MSQEIELHSAPDESQRQLQRSDWIRAALESLMADGIDAVQITTLSKSLSVTRGSFYWHFENREALLAVLIAEWRAKNSGTMTVALEKSASLQDAILDLFAVWVDHERFDPSLDQAVRDWARRSSDVRSIVEKEDENRVAAIAAMFERFGCDDTEAFIRARVIYFTQLSYYALNIDEPLTKRASYLSAYYRVFTGQEIEDHAAMEFIDRVGTMVTATPAKGSAKR